MARVFAPLERPLVEVLQELPAAGRPATPPLAAEPQSQPAAMALRALPDESESQVFAPLAQAPLDGLLREPQDVAQQAPPALAARRLANWKPRPRVAPRLQAWPLAS